ncbi:MAG TPA: class I SAM-dependent methyltransferase, partial [Clostridiales bacterium]|nr:class I SAM-dependent methyltransferase [Clostridiales bacterium]
MGQYTSFAAVYDMFMDNVPYDQWTDYLVHLLNKYGIHEGLILELACGTGSMTRRLSNKGFDMIGIDSSEEMLTIARDKSADKDSSILYLCQDMREFELFGTVAAVVSVCDSMNYITSEEDLLDIFKLVNNYLDPKGLFIFDLDTEYAYKEIIADQTIAESREEGCFIWENTYYEEEMINQIDLTLFIPAEEKNSNNLFVRQEETHYRRAYSIDTIKRLIEKAGMEWVTAFHTLSEDAPRKDSERIYV